MNEIYSSVVLAIIAFATLIYSIKEKELATGLCSFAILLLALVKIIYYLTIE